MVIGGCCGWYGQEFFKWGGIMGMFGVGGVFGLRRNVVLFWLYFYRQWVVMIVYGFFLFFYVVGLFMFCSCIIILVMYYWVSVVCVVLFVWLWY